MHFIKEGGVYFGMGYLCSIFERVVIAGRIEKLMYSLITRTESFRLSMECGGDLTCVRKFCLIDLI